MKLLLQAAVGGAAAFLVLFQADHAAGETYFRYSVADGHPNPMVVSGTLNSSCFTFTGNKVSMTSTTSPCHLDPYWQISPPSRNTVANYLIFPWVTGKKPGSQGIEFRVWTYTQVGDSYSGGAIVIPTAPNFDIAATQNNAGLTVPAYGTFTVIARFLDASSPYTEWHGVAYNYVP